MIELASVARTAAAHEGEEQVTTLPKPEKRKNAKERAKAKFAKKTEKTAEDGTRPMTVTAKSEADPKTKVGRGAVTKSGSEVTKAERKAKDKTKKTAKKAA